MVRTAFIALAALVLGAVGALAYSHFLGEGSTLADVQDDLVKTKEDLANARHENQEAKTQSATMAQQIQQLSTSKDDLQRQLDEAKPPVTATDSAPDPNPMTAMIQANLTQHYQEQLDLLKKRLNLTPDQEAKIKAALDAEEKVAGKYTAQMLSGKKGAVPNPNDFKGVKTLQQTLDEILTPDQKTAYQQMKTDQKNSSAETMASIQMNQMAPALQLNDSQKDQVEGALYQAQLDSQDPNWIKANVNTSDPTSILDAQAKAKEDALAKILTPDQLATYHQQAQAQLDMQKAMMKNFMPKGSSSATTPTAPAGP